MEKGETMDFKKYDVIIVGGGPAGCIVGENIKHGNVLIIEEHQEIGVPLQCAGLVSKKGVKELGNPRGCVNTVRGAYIYSKNNHVMIGNDEIRAHVFERKVMDKDIAIRASKNKNVDILLKAHGKLFNITKHENKNKNVNKNVNDKYFKKCKYWNKNTNNNNFYGLLINHFGKKYEVHPNIIVGADGAKSCLRKSANIVSKREILSGAQLEMVNVSNIDDDFVYVFYDRKYCKDFFIWIIPMGKDRVRVGLCDRGNTYNKLLRFIEYHPVASEFLKDAVPVEFSVGALPIGTVETSVKNNLILVGDAAGQVKPLSGGGLYYGAKSAKICAKIINEYLLNNHPLNYLKTYDYLWRKDIGSEIDFGIKFRKILKNINDKYMDMLLEFIINNNLIDIINKKGDMDNPSTIVEDLFKKFIKSCIGVRI